MQTLTVGFAGSFVVKVAVPVTAPGAVGSTVTVKLRDSPGGIEAFAGAIVMVALL